MCFVQACATGFAAMQAAPMLSHHITGHEELGTCSSFSKPCTQVTFAAVWANALYTYSVLDLATTFCLRELHEMMLGPRKTQKPLVDLRSSTKLTQSASEKLVRLKREAGWMCRPWSILLRKYLNTCSQAFQSISVGQCRNWLNLFTM